MGGKLIQHYPQNVPIRAKNNMMVGRGENCWNNISTIWVCTKTKCNQVVVDLAETITKIGRKVPIGLEDFL